MRRWYGLLTILIPVWLLLAGCAVNPATGRSELMLISEQEERQLGEATDESVVAEYGIYPDVALQSYLNSVARPLARESHRPGLDWQFKVMDSSVVNAFAAPGGYVFVTRGLLAAVSDEAELAGVLAHEIGHVTARHSARNYSQSLLAGIGVQLGTALAGDYGQAVGTLLEAGTGMLFLKYSRDDERQADALGVEYAAKGGYDTNRMADFFATLQRQEQLNGASGGLPEWFSTHPSPVDREAAVRGQTREWQGRLPGRAFRIERDAYLAKIDGMVYGDDPRQGFHEGDTFYVPRDQVQFRVPKGWTLQREAGRVQMIDPQQSAAILFAVEAGEAGQKAREFAVKMQAAVKEFTERPVNGLQARRLVSTVADGKTRTHIVSYFIQKGADVFSFHGLAAEADFPRLASPLELSALSFAAITDRDKLNRAPKKVTVRTVGKGTTLEALLAEEKVDRALWPRVAWMNELTLADRLQPGQRVKLVK